MQHPPITVAAHPDKGRGVFAARDIAAGEVILTDLPVVLYPQACGAADAAAFCAHCLRAVPPGGGLPCPGRCGAAAFCDAACAAAAAADPGSHCALVCATLAAANTAGLGEDPGALLQFLSRAHALRAAAAAGDAGASARWHAVLGLDAGANGGTQQEVPPAVLEVHGRLAHALAVVAQAPPCGVPPALLAQPFFTPAEAADLARRDERNAYGIMAPSTVAEDSGAGRGGPAAAAAAADDDDSGSDGGGAPRRVLRLRGAGIYPLAAMFNHDCLPCAARFDAFDAPPEGGGGAAPPGGPPPNAGLHFRALHDVPAGEEVCVSYFPLDWPLAERAARVAAQYGFACRCARCRLEATWQHSGSGSDAGMADGGGGGGEGSELDGADEVDGVTEAYVGLFLLRHVCAGGAGGGGCGGTLAPVPGCAAGRARAYECNACGAARTEADFLAELGE